MIFNRLELLLRSTAEAKVNRVVLFSDGLHLREIARRAGISSFEAKTKQAIEKAEEFLEKIKAMAK